MPDKDNTPLKRPEAIFRVVKEGEYSASTGAFDISKEDILEIIEAFDEAKGLGVLPALKYTHAKGVNAVGVGEVTELWMDGEWLMAKAIVLDPEMREGLKKGTLTNISLEGQSGTAYGERKYPLVLTAISILAPGEWPAVPGAKLTDIAAGQTSERVVINLDNTTDDIVMAEEPAVEEPIEEEPIEEAPIDEELEVDDPEVTIEDRLLELEARILSIEEQIAEPLDELVEEEEPIEEAPVEEPAEEEGIDANLADVENKILAGKREEFREYYDGLEDDSAKQIVLKAMTVLADLEAAPEVLASDSNTEDGETKDLSREDRQEQSIRDIMSRDNTGFVKATSKAVKENPELFREGE